MCGIAGALSLSRHPVKECHQKLMKMSSLLDHRGPDDEGFWVSSDQRCGLAHRRLSIIDVSEGGHQPMMGNNHSVLVFNGAIYNYQDLQISLKSHWQFRSNSDTEVLLAAHAVYGDVCLSHLRGMFAFAIWDGDSLFCARDRFGIKPFYYTLVDNTFYFASEAKALLALLPAVETDEEAFSEYLTFQCQISEKTLFKGIYQLLPGHAIKIQQGQIKIWRYWQTDYHIDHGMTDQFASEKLTELMSESIYYHLKSDVPLGAYVGGGMDSSLIALLASQYVNRSIPMFHGKFTQYDGYDESYYAQIVANQVNSQLYIADLTANDFEKHIKDIIYYLDFPVAGPGAFGQYMISAVAAKHVKVVLGGQGADEIFGGYARYFITYFEQCLRACIDDVRSTIDMPIHPETMIRNLSILKTYQPTIKQVWSKNLFGNLSRRYFDIINRALDFADEVDPAILRLDERFDQFNSLFSDHERLKGASYFDHMLRFDFEYLLPGLLHVEDRITMAHGLEARVPFLDHPLVEFMATVPSSIKFKNGSMKSLMKQTFERTLPDAIIKRKDKMGFPVPLTEWAKNNLREFVLDTLHTAAAKHRPFIDYKKAIHHIGETGQYSRKIWAFLSYELWHQSYHDQKCMNLKNEKTETIQI